MTNEKTYIKVLFYIFYIYLASLLFLIWLDFYTTNPGMGDVPPYADSNIFTLMSTPPLFICLAAVVVLFTKNVTVIKYIVFFYIIVLANRGMGITLFGVDEVVLMALTLETPNFLGNLFFYLRLRNK